jgi:hypothetical protein
MTPAPLLLMDVFCIILESVLYMPVIPEAGENV